MHIRKHYDHHMVDVMILRHEPIITFSTDDEDSHNGGSTPPMQNLD